ncbi:hypothetical protein ACTFRD_16995 [Bacillus cereus group sp. MYBK249-1]|uniref:Uncharacterized protein n=1 Tax=Bacillus cereus TaxID=1396 RepID=A0AB34D4F7_BACCE|nr:MULTISPECIES: hypothetical protein [Bacillus]KAB2493906.1 hypothetical protein F8158_21240 [Bacillus cereus]MCP1324507.1 hypothetical protein [Bacillus sp. S0628]PFQ56694.1 hypothetical protein COK18_29430 [Bacillus cereus]UDV84568.1 hypothetical protein HQJ03_011615 [Bacillus cereus]UDV90114.1 hypothetical protein HQG80_011600 [Bacillus cereus]
MEKQNIVSAQINIDTTEAKANIEELTLAINECVSAFEKLEKVMNKYTGEAETVELYLDGKAVAREIIQNDD